MTAAQKDYLVRMGVDPWSLEWRDARDFGLTEYLVLSKEIEGRNPDDEEVVLTGWLLHRAVTARSARAAIQEHLKEDGTDGEFVAVPARSWKPVTVKVETKTELRFT